MALSLSSRRVADAVTVSAQGEVDLPTADDLEREIAAAVGSDATAILVDLGGVTFLDSAGINVLLKGRRLADQHGKSYRVAGAQGMVRQLLRMTGVWEHLSTPPAGG
ncbi:STAS domain-containing protein [Micromonospora sp. WMMD812]|uniref:STAS domain-containing protein n=1 Tax=Micromonospora sp. WMMD812 TaxID=3015152 RepID=UPI00248B745B|nr:STAS domain-containing protein [Micromonospora sp. WMMD812]WBB69943.1 STAS domain-containing protein [Micromonospora sp. WMMD812]